MPLGGSLWRAAGPAITRSGYGGLVPEGDTIHHAAHRIRAALLGKTLDRVLAPHPRLAFARWPAQLTGRSLTAVQAHGKHLLLSFEGGLTVHSHLRMTGAWGVYSRGQPWRRAPSRAWLVLGAGDVEAVQFDGPVLELREDSRLRFDRALSSLGPDLLAESFDERALLARLQAGAGERAIGEALLDQRLIAGIGNVWKSESCFAAGVDPWRIAVQVPEERVLDLLRFARQGMRRCAIEGHQARPKSVYGRRGRPCLRCGAPILSRGQGDQNRVTFWCPSCQR
jgi:endonuclease VIII